MVHAQQPTCTSLRIRSTQDTHKIFYAVQKGLLKMVTRRLDADERLALRSGCVYAWEERGPHSEITGLGIERFTEGRRWTPSRVRDEFLFYYERYMPTPDASQAGPPAESKPPRDWEPLVKQTYSVWVDTEGGRRKWHLTAYFTQGTIDQLGTVDDLPALRELTVPDGLFKSTRVGKGRSAGKQDDARPESSTKSTSTVTRTYAAFPSIYPVNSSPDSSLSNPPVLMFDPYQQNTTSSGYYHGQSQPPSQPQSVKSSQSHSRSSQSPQSHSSTSLSPNLPSSRTQYPSDRATCGQAQGPPTPPTYGDIKPELRPRVLDPASPRHQAHSSHQPEYRLLPPSAQSALSPLADSGQRAENLPPSLWAQHAAAGPASYQCQTQAQAQATNGSGHPSGDVFPVLHYSGSPPSNVGPTGTYRLPPSPDGIACSPLTTQDSLDAHRTSLPPLHIPAEETRSSYELSPSTYAALHYDPAGRTRALAPLHALNRQHPYRREQLDDKALRMLQAASASSLPI